VYKRWWVVESTKPIPCCAGCATPLSHESTPQRHKHPALRDTRGSGRCAHGIAGWTSERRSVRRRGNQTTPFPSARIVKTRGRLFEREAWPPRRHGELVAGRGARPVGGRRPRHAHGGVRPPPQVQLPRCATCGPSLTRCFASCIRMRATPLAEAVKPQKPKIKTRLVAPSPPAYTL